MTEPTPLYGEVFFEVFEALPRQGPGDRASTARALASCDGLPVAPSIVDLGCGVGAQTLHLAELTGASIVAVDNHAPFLDRLALAAAERGLARRIHPLLADIAATGLRPASFDLVWSEGALYQIGLDAALRVCRDLLRPGGYLAFTDAVWRRDDPPAAVRASFEIDYPAMGAVDRVVAVVAGSGLELVDHFTLPDDAWWHDFYTPLQARVRGLRHVHASDPGALAVLDQLDAEADMHDRYSDYYAYEFFITRRPAWPRCGPARRRGSPAG
ncbi:MAG: class I SAM-dependent methyltransferase [Acidimicrobiales bacterium]|nr:class I SAM-dependent methyltransferase [Acidimicrobiales bacterium]